MGRRVLHPQGVLRVKGLHRPCQRVLLIRDICFFGSVRVVPSPIYVSGYFSFFFFFFFSALVSFICYYLLCQISNASSFCFPCPSPFPSPSIFLSLSLFLSLCYYSANIKDAAAHWVTQSAACQAAVHEVTWQLIWQVPCRPGTSPSLPHLLLIPHLLVVVFSITHT